MSAERSPLHRSRSHESAWGHVTGEARYTDDLAMRPGVLTGWPIESPHAHARLLRIDARAARALPGVKAVLFAADIPGENRVGPIFHDEPLLAESEVWTRGQLVGLVVADDDATCRAALKLIEIDWEPLPALLDLRASIEAGEFLHEPHIIERGDVEAALAGAVHIVEGEVHNGYQDHFYLETQCALAVPEEAGRLKVYSSTQHPSECQLGIAHVLGIGRNEVTVEVPRVGGGFGGKESQATNYAALAALGAQVTGAPVRLWLNREQDMVQTGKRHPFFSRYRAGFDAEGRFVGFSVQIYSEGGWTRDLSTAVMDRAVFHLDNCYWIPNLRFRGQVVRTHRCSNTAFRGFGGPQGILVVEQALNTLAEQAGFDPAELRRVNYYRPEGERDIAPYGQPIRHIRLQRIHAELMESSGWAHRRAAIDAFNQTSRWVKRGLGFMPVKFGISFTNSVLNQAGALVLVYADGTVQLNHGGTEMGQGLHTKMMAVCADTLGVPLQVVRAMPTATDKVPNTVATAASSGSDLNGQAVKAACETIRERMRAVAARRLGVEPAEIEFEAGVVSAGGSRLGFAELAQQCWVEQVSLAATGFYRTPGIHYDHARGRGRPFFYFAYGASVIEVEVNGLTGEYRVVAADVLHDVGNSLVPSIDLGQVEGAFVQGLGWLTTEELVFSEAGALRTASPSTYKIPAVGDVPLDLKVALLQRAPQDGVIGGSKAVGEPPLMLAIGVIQALRHAVGGFGPGVVELSVPATPEAVLDAVTTQQRRARAAQGA